MSKLTKEHLRRVLRYRWHRIILFVLLSSGMVWMMTYWDSDDGRVLGLASLAYLCMFVALLKVVQTTKPMPPVEPVEPVESEDEEEQP